MTSLKDLEKQLAELDLPPTEQDDSPDQLKTAALRKEQLTILTKSPIWGMVCAFVEEQKSKREKLIWATVLTRDNMDEQNYTRGEINGLLILGMYLKSLTGDYDNVIQLFHEQEEQINATRYGNAG